MKEILLKLDENELSELRLAATIRISHIEKAIKNKEWTDLKGANWSIYQLQQFLTKTDNF